MFRLTGGGLVLLWVVLAAVALAQPQSFPQQPFGAPVPPSPSSRGGYAAPTPQPVPPAPQTGGNFANESTEVGVRPQAELQTNVGSPTPTSIPGAQVLTTMQLLEGMQHGGLTLLLVDALYDQSNAHATLPGATRLPYAGQPGTFADPIQQRLQADLAQATNNRQDIPIIFFCAGPNCWESYNAALRAERMGYQKVFWYRGGLAAWQAANLPLMPGTMPPPPNVPGGAAEKGMMPPAGNPAGMMLPPPTGAPPGAGGR